MLLPALYIFNDGRGVAVEWQADEIGMLHNMPGEFFDSGVVHIERGPTEITLAEFIAEVIRRVEGVDDERVVRLTEAWRAVQGADAEETAFCVAAGRMGLDPYDPSQVSDELAGFIMEE